MKRLEKSFLVMAAAGFLAMGAFSCKCPTDGDHPGDHDEHSSGMDEHPSDHPSDHPDHPSDHPDHPSDHPDHPEG
jgi:hypothetical protein